MLFIIACVYTAAVGASTPERRVVGKVCSSGRLVEQFSDPFMAKLDNETATRLSNQFDSDISNDDFTPTVHDYFSENTPIGYISLGQMIHEGKFSTLFSIKDFPNLVIKYQVQCEGLNEDIHPLLRDAWYTNKTSEFGLSPKIHFVSPASELCDRKYGKCAFIMDLDQWEECYKDRGPLRYMIMDRAPGSSLHRYRRNRYHILNGAMRFVDAMVI